MSAENITLFFEKAEGSEELQEKINDIAEMEQEPQIEALSQLSVEEGLPFTVEEFHNNVPPFSELNDEQLESVAGGRSNKQLAWDFLRFIGNVYKSRGRGRGRHKHKKH